MPRSVRLYYIAALLSISTILLVAPGCSRRTSLVDEALQTQVLHVGNGSEIQSLDPHLAGGTIDHNVLSTLFEGLVSLDETTLAPRPAGAEHWEVSPNGLTYTFHLRRTARWSNGDPITVRDWLYSFQRALSPALGSEYKDIYFAVRGARAFATGELTDFTQVGFERVDDWTLRIHLERPTAYFLTLLRQNAWYPVHAASVEHGGAAPDDRTARWTTAAPLISNGPFRLRAWRERQHLHAEKNPHYWDAPRVRLNEIRFYPAESTQSQELAFRAGQLHITWDVPVNKLDAYQRDDLASLRQDPFYETYFLRFNVTRPPFDDVRIRRALALALDRESLVRNVTRGGQRAATAFVPPGLGGYESGPGLPHDPVAARTLLAEAGFPGGRGFPAVDLLTISSDINQRLAEAIQQMWRVELGIDIAITQQEFKVYLDAIDNRTLAYSVARGRWIAEFPDPLTFLSNFMTGNGVNGTGFADAEFDAQVLAADRAPTAAERLAGFRAAEARLVELAPFAPIYWGTRTLLVHPTVRGWKPSPLGFRNYKDLWLER